MKRITPKSNWPQDVTYLQLPKEDNRFFAWVDFKRERIYLSPKWETCSDIDLYVWHEYRHILHYRHGLFENYYKGLKKIKSLIVNNPGGWIKYALEAEMDCDAYAEQVTGKSFANTYPMRGVWFFDFAVKHL